MLLSKHFPRLLLLTLWSTGGVSADDDCGATPLTLELESGRTLAFCEFGSEEDSAVVVLHCNGSGGSRLEWPGNEKMLQELGIRFVAVDRPGHGFSDPQPEGRTLLDWPRMDVTQLLTHLNVDQFYVEGWSAGGSYALAVAHEFGDRVLGGAILSGIGPYDRPNPLEGMESAQIRQWMEWARAQNETAILAFREQMVPLLQNSNASEIGKLLGSGGTGIDDLEVDRNPDLQYLMGANIKEGYRQGAAGPAQDDLVINRPWEFKLQDIDPKVHIDVWQGEVDQNVPLNQGVYQDSILPNSTLHILNDTAHLFPLVKWEEILRTLVAPSSLSSSATADEDGTTEDMDGTTDQNEDDPKQASLGRKVSSCMYIVSALVGTLLLLH